MLRCGEEGLRRAACERVESKKWLRSGQRLSEGQGCTSRVLACPEFFSQEASSPSVSQRASAAWWSPRKRGVTKTSIPQEAQLNWPHILSLIVVWFSKSNPGLVGQIHFGLKPLKAFQWSGFSRGDPDKFTLGCKWQYQFNLSGRS